MARDTFLIPHEGESVVNIPSDAIQKVLDVAITIISDDKILKVATIGGHYKVLVHIIYQCFIGLLGSKDQISSIYKKMLTAIVSNTEWDWETLFLEFLKDAKDKSATSHKFRTSLKVSAMILNATEGRNITWPSTKPIPGNVVFQLKAAPKKKATTRKAATKKLTSPFFVLFFPLFCVLFVWFFLCVCMCLCLGGHVFGVMQVWGRSERKRAKTLCSREACFFEEYFGQTKNMYRE